MSRKKQANQNPFLPVSKADMEARCLLYTSDAADEL